MKRGTTATLTLEVDADLREAAQIWVTLEDSAGAQVNVEKAAMNVTEGAVVFALTQAQTLSLSAGRVYVQLRALLGGAAVASDMAETTLERILREGVISEDQA